MSFFKNNVQYRLVAFIVLSSLFFYGVFTQVNAQTISRKCYSPVNREGTPVEGYLEPCGTAQQSQQYTPRVLVIGYNPVEKNVSVADKYFKNAMQNRTALENENYVFNNAVTAFQKLSQNSISFQLVKTLHITDFPIYPDGFKYSLQTYAKCVWGSPGFDALGCDRRKYQFDYVNWFQKYHICEEADAVQADEIWVLSPPYLLAWEDFMVGPTPGFYINGGIYTVPNCKKHYPVVNGTYDQPDMFLHDFGHRVEGTMNYLTENWKKSDQDKYWNSFAGIQLYNGQTMTSAYCGNTHFPSNARSAYDDVSMAITSSRCADWKNFPNVTNKVQSVNCTKWNCSDPGWQVYWLGSLPRSNGSVTLRDNQGKSFHFNKNWWSYILYPDAAMQQKSLQ